MRSLIFLVALCLTAAVSGKPPQERIIGGSVTTIENYPFAVAALRLSVAPTLACGAVILNNRSVLTTARCFYGTVSTNWRLRIGSSFVYNGGSVYTVTDLIYHPDYQAFSVDAVGIFRLSSPIVFGDNVQPGRFASANYIVADNEPVWTYGWGATYFQGPISNQLKHVQIRTVNHETCRRNYNIISMPVTENEICAGNLEQGGQDPCEGDFGGALLHNGNVIGISSNGGGDCGVRFYPSIYTLVPKYIDWIVANA